jgi:hypothetical protein
MTKDLKGLAKLIALCRKQGVSAIEFDGVKLQLGELPKVVSPRKPIDLPNFDPGVIPKPLQPWETASEDKIETDYPTEEELLFYSATGEPNQ